MTDKEIFRYERAFTGGTPEVFRYYSSDKRKNIDIMTASGVYRKVEVHLTIGLFRTGLSLTARGKRVRTELIVFGDNGDPEAPRILSTAAFGIMDTGECFHGLILPQAFGCYDAGTETPHGLLLTPFCFRNYKELETEDTIVAWLLLVPISERERAYIEKNGLPAFERILERQDTDITDRKRRSFV